VQRDPQPAGASLTHNGSSGEAVLVTEQPWSPVVPIQSPSPYGCVAGGTVQRASEAPPTGWEAVPWRLAAHRTTEPSWHRSTSTTIVLRKLTA